MEIKPVEINDNNTIPASNTNEKFTSNIDKEISHKVKGSISVNANIDNQQVIILIKLR